MATLALLSCDLFDIFPPEIEIVSPKDNASYVDALSCEINATDNQGVTKVEVLLDNVSIHEFTKEPFTASLDVSGQSAGTKTFKATAYDKAGNHADAQCEVRILKESVSAPARPTGPSSGNVGTAYSYSTSGASSSIDHSLQYRFDWGDGSYSNWSSSTSASHSWNTTGTKYVKAQARCAAHNSVVSSWSSSKVVTIAEWSPVLVGSYDTPGSARDVFVSGSYAYVADDISGLRIVNVSNPASPTLAGSYDTPDDAWGVFVSGSYAYVADRMSGLQVINISNPASPTLTSTYDAPYYAYDVFVSGSYAYVANSYGLQIVNVSNPASPTLAGSYDTPGSAYGVFVSGSYAYMANNDGLQIVNVSNPASPTQAGSCDTPGSAAKDVFVSGSYAYVADGRSGLQVINISNPASPTLAGTYDTPDFAWGIFVSGGYAYVADGQSGLQVINVSNPASLTLAGSYDTPGYAYSVFASGNYAYVADGESGLQILDLAGLP